MDGRMARKKNVVQNGRGLFDEQLQQLERRIRRQRALFIPKYLRAAAASFQLQGAAQDRAYDIAVRWADLETSGRLPEYRWQLGAYAYAVAKATTLPTRAIVLTV